VPAQQLHQDARLVAQQQQQRLLDGAQLDSHAVEGAKRVGGGEPASVCVRVCVCVCACVHVCVWWMDGAHMDGHAVEGARGVGGGEPARLRWLAAKCKALAHP